MCVCVDVVRNQSTINQTIFENRFIAEKVLFLIESANASGKREKQNRDRAL